MANIEILDMKNNEENVVKLMNESVMNESVMNELVINNLSKIEKINIGKVINLPSYHDTLFIQIHNNEIYTKNIVKEERHLQILNQLKKVTVKYVIPNCIFAYSTRDDYPNKEHFIFTHAKIKDTNTNNILAPCFTFDSYPEKDPANFISYEQSYNDLISIGEKYINDISIWNEKQNSLVFVGSIHSNNYRDINTNFKGIPTIIKNLDAASGNRFISRSELANYKYLLHLNGNNGAYASRLKYLLMTGSLVLYITKYYKNNNYQIEYWMNHDIFKRCLIHFNDTEECQNFILNKNISDEIKYNIAINGYYYIKYVLHPEKILLYWKLLLDAYSSKIMNPVNNLLYTHKYI